MGKLVPALMATGGATAVSVGGVCLARNSGTGADATTTPENPSSVITNGNQSSTSLPAAPDFKFATVELFKSDMKNSECVNSYFGTAISDKPDASQISAGAPNTDSFFKVDEPTGTDDYKSCLTIERKVTKYTNEGKGNGKFAWLWTFMRGEEGFINFNVAESSNDENGKMKFSGIFYLVEKKSDNWEIKYKHEPKSNIPDSSGDIDTYFPKASDGLKGSVGGEYWGLADDLDKFKKPCKTGECGDGGKEEALFKKEFTGTKGTDNTKKLGGGSKDLTGGSSIYDSSNGNLTDKIANFNGEGSPKSS